MKNFGLKKFVSLKFGITWKYKHIKIMIIAAVIISIPLWIIASELITMNKRK